MIKFAHISDVHLGYRQYGLEQRRDDFLSAFRQCADKCVEEQVDFVIIAGDLFHTKNPDYYDLIKAQEVLLYLYTEEIMVYSILGNHDIPGHTDRASWLDLFEFVEGPVGGKILEEGGYYNIENQIAISMVNWCGQRTNRILAELETNFNSCDYRILMLHAGLDEILHNHSGNVSYKALEPLKEQVNYVALGHIHKPYVVQDWIYNPGSLESNSSSEWDWTDRGMNIVSIEDGKHSVERFVPKRRNTAKLTVEADDIDRRFPEQSMLQYTILHDGLNVQQKSNIEAHIRQLNDPLYLKIDFVTREIPQEYISVKRESPFEQVFGKDAELAKRMMNSIIHDSPSNEELMGMIP